MKWPLFRMLWCERVAPFGNPVVPDVYWMLIGSSNWSPASRTARLIPQLAVGGAVALVANDERLSVAEAFHRRPQPLADRLAEQRQTARTVGVRRRGHGSRPRGRARSSYFFTLPVDVLGSSP